MINPFTNGLGIQAIVDRQRAAVVATRAIIGGIQVSSIPPVTLPVSAARMSAEMSVVASQLQKAFAPLNLQTLAIQLNPPVNELLQMRIDQLLGPSNRLAKLVQLLRLDLGQSLIDPVIQRPKMLVKFDRNGVLQRGRSKKH